jgi:hypothetical protein
MKQWLTSLQGIMLFFFVGGFCFGWLAGYLSRIEVEIRQRMHWDDETHEHLRRQSEDAKRRAA